MEVTEFGIVMFANDLHRSKARTPRSDAMCHLGSLRDLAEELTDLVVAVEAGKLVPAAAEVEGAQVRSPSEVGRLRASYRGASLAERTKVPSVTEWRAGRRGARGGGRAVPAPRPPHKRLPAQLP